jgi:hypothetical protein
MRGFGQQSPPPNTDDAKPGSTDELGGKTELGHVGQLN